MHRKLLSLLLLTFILPLSIIHLTSCKKDDYSYSGELNLESHSWLKGRKIFLDPGHGGLAERTPEGRVTEEEVNLSVALFLKDMLIKSGAEIFITREKDIDIPLDARVEMAKKFQPELLISIHHDGANRLKDQGEINFPTVLFWGSKKNRPASIQFASLLLDELNKIMEPEGLIISDHAVFKETGVRILRKTKYLCPGVLGEGGFFTNPKHEIRLKDISYNQLEAEAYFKAISSFFKRGLPTAELHLSKKLIRSGGVRSILPDRKATIGIKIIPDIKVSGIYKNSLKATLNGLPIKFKKSDKNLYVSKLKGKLYPGKHRIKFRFKNKLSQNSMVYNGYFYVQPKKGEIAKNISKGIKIIKRNDRRQVKKALQMLIPAYDISPYYPGNDRVAYYIGRGLRLIKDKAGADKYFQKIYHLYPNSKYTKRALRYSKPSSTMPTDYYGKELQFKFTPSL